MESTPFDRLTEKEREALRLVLTHRSLRDIAGALGISESGVKARLIPAMAKLDAANRFEAARAFASYEGWLPYPDHAGSNEQVVDQLADDASDADRAMSEPVMTGAAAPGLPLRDALLRRSGGHNDLSKRQRLIVAAAVFLVALALFVMLLATITETGKFGLSLYDRGLNSM